jgi:RecA-family ATPase
MTAFEIVQKKLQEDMVQGQMHTTLRDIGRLAGGYATTGALNGADLQALEDYAAGRSTNPKEGRSKWREAVAFGRSQPITFEATRQRAEPEGFDWTDSIKVGKHKSAERPVVDERWVEAVDIPAPAAGWNPGDMIRYFEAVFEPDERIGINVRAFQKEDGKWMPADKGTFDRTRAELCQLLNQHREDIGAVLGDINNECGAWVRINPLDGEGAKDANVTAYRHSLIEADGQELGKQLAMIRKLNLPCSAIVHSGGKSIHAVVRVDATDLQDYRRRVDRLYEVCEKSGLKVDSACRNPSRLSRLPGVERNGGAQYLIDTRCGAASFDAWISYVEDTHDQLPDPESLASVWDAMPDLDPEVIKGILRKGHKMLIAGPSKAAKSFMLEELCVCIAEGRPWLGWEVMKGPVLYVNLELARASCMHRFRTVYQAMGIEPHNLADIDVWNLRGNTVPLDRLAPKLIRRSQARNYVAIILDPIYKILTGDENSAEEMGAFCNLFDRIGTALGAATVYAHHHSKGSQGAKRSIDRSSGSGVFGRDPDACLDLIELDISKDRRGVLVDKHAWVALERLADTLRLDLSGIDEGTRSQADAFLMAVQTAFPAHAPDFANCLAATRTAVGLMTGWRIEANLREFAAPPPRRIWFRYPVHTEDDHGLLLDAKAAGEEAPWEASRRAKDDVRKANADSAREDLENAIEAAGGACQATVQDVAEALGITAKTVRNRIERLRNWRIENNTILRAKTGAK